MINVWWLLQIPSIPKYEGHFRVDFFLTLQRDFKLIPSRSREAGVTKSENQFSLILVEYRFIAIRGPWKKHASVMCCPSCRLRDFSRKRNNNLLIFLLSKQKTHTKDNELSEPPVSYLHFASGFSDYELIRGWAATMGNRTWSLLLTCKSINRQPACRGHSTREKAEPSGFLEQGRSFHRGKKGIASRGLTVNYRQQFQQIVSYSLRDDASQ